MLAVNEEWSTFAADVADQRLRTNPNNTYTADLVAHRLQLLRGGDARVDPDLRLDNYDILTSRLHLIAREAIEAGESDTAMTVTRSVATKNPHGQAVLAAIEAAANHDEDRWHDTLRIAVAHNLRLVAADALEGLAAGAAAAESWEECLRLSAAARQLRDEIGYRWRFGFEQRALDAALDAARTALGPETAQIAEVEGSGRPWQNTRSEPAANASGHGTAGPASPPPKNKSSLSWPRG